MAVFWLVAPCSLVELQCVGLYNFGFRGSAVQNVDGFATFRKSIAVAIFRVNSSRGNLRSGMCRPANEAGHFYLRFMQDSVT
jgi:hypothetical protein